jgi:hypothetical protein
VRAAVPGYARSDCVNHPAITAGLRWPLAKPATSMAPLRPDHAEGLVSRRYPSIVRSSGAMRLSSTPRTQRGVASDLAPKPWPPSPAVVLLPAPPPCGHPSRPLAGCTPSTSSYPVRLPLLGPRTGQDFVPTIVETVMA